VLLFFVDVGVRLHRDPFTRIFTSPLPLWSAKVNAYIVAVYSCGGSFMMMLGFHLMMMRWTGDPFTRFLPPEEGQAFENATEGETVSLGLQISVMPDERVRVAVVIEGSPAERAGVLPGDFLLAVNGRPVDPSDKMCDLPLGGRRGEGWA
jgi:hypothetical protein